VLGEYVRRRGVVSLEAAIARMTSKPAARLGLRDRGTVRDGAFADLAVFDARTIDGPATYDAPHQYAVGVRYLVVNGALVIDDGALTAARPGRTLRRETTVAVRERRVPGRSTRR
jgi:N-acyl-D-amino-acid deacylase